MFWKLPLRSSSHGADLGRFPHKVLQRTKFIFESSRKVPSGCGSINKCLEVKVRRETLQRTGTLREAELGMTNWQREFCRGGGAERTGSSLSDLRATLSGTAVIAETKKDGAFQGEAGAPD